MLWGLDGWDRMGIWGLLLPVQWIDWAGYRIQTRQDGGRNWMSMRIMIKQAGFLFYIYQSSNQEIVQHVLYWPKI